MSANRRRGVGCLIGVTLLLVGCSPAVTLSPTFTPTSTTTTTTATAAPTKPTPSPGSPEAKITATIQGYSDFLTRAFTDPSVPATDAANYLADLPPDYVFEAVQRGILQFRAKGYKQTGSAPISVISITNSGDGTYKASVCQVAESLKVTDAQGQAVDAGPPRSSAAYTLVQDVDGVWRISKIQGTGTSC